MLPLRVQTRVYAGSYERSTCSQIFSLTVIHTYSQILLSLSLFPSVLEVRKGEIMSVMDVSADDIHTLLLAVQMKLTVDPTVTLCALGSSIETSIGLDGKAGEGKRGMTIKKEECLCLFTNGDLKKRYKIIAFLYLY